MMKNATRFGLLATLLFVPITSLFAQMDELHGDYNARAKNVYSGNRIRITFFNDGDIGGRGNDDYRGDWPKNNKDGAQYIYDSVPLIGAEVLDRDNQKIHIVSEAHASSGVAACQGDVSPTGDWWTFLPLPGFHNPREQAIAMSQTPETWPGFWPDKVTAEDPGWSGAWNGYFGKNRFNADQESYYVYDDYANAEFSFYPDSTDSTRRGLGIRVTARGFQWSNVLVEDILFCLFDVKNVGTHLHDRVVFGNKTGFGVGASTRESDNNDDVGKFMLEEDLAVSFDLDNRGAPGGWNPVGLVGIAYLESPGYPYDGIDNDEDGTLGSGDLISVETFDPKILQVGDPLVFIDYQTFERTVANAFQETLDNPYYHMDQDTIKIFFLKQEFFYTPGDTLLEIELDNLDNNFNGIIDENNGSTFGKDPNNQIQRYLYIGHKYVNYITGNGLDNLLIDERRDDGIDNNNNWTLTDDLGLDGNKNTLDQGQGDGVPTSGWQNGIDTEQPGEPHIDKTDINESDMIGLTAFELLKPFTSMPIWNDERVWESIRPGHLDDIVLLGDDVDMSFGSGYFAMVPGQIERYSMSYQLAFTEEDLIRVKNWGALAYAENYQFATAPETPTISAVAGNGQVTLYWDSKAEFSVDPLVGQDFEGYRIYRSTDALWNDMKPITDSYGNPVYRVPVAQFDLKDEYQGYFPLETRGVMFSLGENTGITHSWTDTTVTNGIKYYYAITSYDRGSTSYGVPPTECPIILDINRVGEVEKKGPNVVVVTPGTNVSGMPEPPAGSYPMERVSGFANGTAYYSIVNPHDMKGENSYRLTFTDTVYVDTLGEAITIYRPATLSLFNLTENAFVTQNDINVQTPLVMDGLQIYFEAPQKLEFDAINSKWSRNDILPFTFDLYRDSDDNIVGDPIIGDFLIEFGEIGMDTSKAFISATNNRDMPPKPVNFTITNIITGEKIPFAFYEWDRLIFGEGAFTLRIANRSDEIILLKPSVSDTVYGYVSSWQLKMASSSSSPDEISLPQSGDYLQLFFDKPFTRSDTLMFTTPEAPQFDESLIAASLDDIQVVPNPYVVTNEFEPTNYYVQGHGDRHLHFVNLPPKCTIRIYTLSGQHVKTIEHDVGIADRGEAIWDMTTKEAMDIGFGVYIYHVDAGKHGEKIGKFAVIK